MNPKQINADYLKEIKQLTSENPFPIKEELTKIAIKISEEEGFNLTLQEIDEIITRLFQEIEN